MASPLALVGQLVAGPLARVGQLVAGPLALVGKLAALALVGQLAALAWAALAGHIETAQAVPSPSAWATGPPRSRPQPTRPRPTTVLAGEAPHAAPLVG